jgi:hypothetical protein
MAPYTLRKDYWDTFDVTEQDLEFLYGHLFNIEKPLTQEDLIRALVEERVRQEKDAIKKLQNDGPAVYYPKDHYQAGQELRFADREWETGTVTAVRPGNNPELPPFEVIDVHMQSGLTRLLAAGLADHKRNAPVDLGGDDSLLDPDYVLEQYGEELSEKLYEHLETNPDLVRIAARWFPRALLVDINAGHLNLAEAVLDMMGGGPMPTRGLMEQVDLPVDVDSNLNEFSLNLALQEDKRFDEVGPSGEVLWYLHRLEPEPVREAPMVLRFHGGQEQSDAVRQAAQHALTEFESSIIDELEPSLNQTPTTLVNNVSLNLIYPHWRAGTLPLAGPLTGIFPTAMESPRIQFTFVDGNSGDRFEGWVVRPHAYVYGLRDWYLSQGCITGSILHVQRGKNPGEVIIRVDKKRASREWIRTAIIGSDGGIVFSMLKHNITAAVDERMAIMISDTEMLDKIWERGGKQRGSLSQTIRLILTEMAKLSPQSHVHAQELYAGVNLLRRCPPGPILSLLLESDWVQHLGNLYFRLVEPSEGNDE